MYGGMCSAALGTSTHAAVSGQVGFRERNA
ncbi:putative cross-wall-targeting lipoprotein signal domain-containing protein [Streptomyces sp. NPDC057806]